MNTDYANYEPPKTMDEIDKQLKNIQNEINRLDVPESQPDEEILINGFKEENVVIEVTPTRSQEN